ncbi:MAG: N-acetylneuraminate synthase family protein [Pseudomonadota bacterium]
MTPLFPQFVAEISSNHNRDLDRCFRMIEAAAKSGCAAAKFQLFRVDELFAPEILRHSPDHRARMDWELPEHFLPRLKACCDDNGIGFACTPFHLDAVDMLEPLTAFYKIASYELLWDGLLEKVAATGKPVVLSTGMANLSEIDHAVRVLKQAGASAITLLHCVSSYPTSAEQANLAAIGVMRDAFGLPVGWSDHSADPRIVLRAALKWEAPMIEFHLDLDEAGAEFDGGHCWLPNAIAQVIEDVSVSLSADGRALKEPVPAEQDERPWRADPEDGLRPLQSTRAVWIDAVHEAERKARA